MKPDASIDYYGLLGIQPNANDDEIKKAFRKQALLHHPDRNPGREDEAKAKFQDVQAAYDTLSTSDKRNKYDNERLRRGNLWQKRPAPAARASTNPAVPPTAPKWDANTTQARPQAKSTAGASRYAEYTKTSRDPSPFTGPDVNAKFQAWKAFENMKGGAYKPAQKAGPSKSRPAPTAQKARTRSDWDETDFPQSPRRAQSTRTPRKAGFNPYAEDGDDTSSRNTSAYYNVKRGERPQASFPTNPNIFAQAGVRPGGAPQTSAANGSGEDTFGERMSTPYTSKTGEKTYFSSAGLGRSASTAANLNHLDPERARHRSASPRARSSQPEPAYDDLTSSSEEETMQTDQQKQSQQSYYTRRGSADPRASGSKVKIEDDSDEPRFAKPRRQQTWDSANANDSSPRTHYRPSSSNETTEPDLQQQMRQNMERNGKGPPKASGTSTHAFNAPNNGSAQPNGFKPALYDYSSFPSASNLRYPIKCSRKEIPAAPRKTSKDWPYWAIPSSVNPGISNIGQSIAAAKEAASFANYQSNVPHNVVQNGNANYDLGNSSFSIPSSSSGSASPTKNASTGNVNTQFSPTDWHGQFTTPSDYLGNQTASGSRANARNRTSPPKRPAMSRSMHTSPPATSHRHNYTSTESRPVPIHVPDNAGDQETTPTKFSSEDWNKHFKAGQWAMPPPPPPAAGRPISTPRSRNSRRTAQAAQTAARSGTGDFKNPFVVDDTGDEGDDEGRASGSNLDTDPEMSRQTSSSTNAMDIDSNTPPTTRMSPTNSNSNGPTPIPHASKPTTPAPNYTFPRPPPPSTAFNMTPLSSAFPLSGNTSSTGLADLKSDLGSTLPFESAASPSARAAPKPQKLVLPHVPKLPLPPGRLTQTSYAVYMNQVAVYMREFHAFNGQMVAHFEARQAQMERMTRETSATIEKGFLPMLNGAGGAGFGASGIGGIGGANVTELAAWSWMGARADEGFQRYGTWMEEDQRVRMHWNVAYERHADALEKLGGVRREMAFVVARGGLS